jgi:membrane protease subunit (stomatin/prohibitin family)
MPFRKKTDTAKRPIVEVIKYDGGPDVFAWKFPNEEIGTWSQLIVNESQEAVLYKGGQALDLFGPGRHTMDTANIPILRKIIALPFGQRSPFTAEVWYVNRQHSLEIKWGTSTPIQLQDPKYNVFIPVRAFGQFGIQIVDSKTFLTKMVGTLPRLGREEINRFFRGVYVTKVKDAIATYLVKEKVSLLEINAYLLELSEHLRERIQPAFDEYGIRLLNFFVKDISVPEDDPSVVQLRNALARRAEMDIVGFSFEQQRSFDVLEGAAKNTGGGQAGMMGAGMGLGMGFGMGGAMGGAFGNMAQNINTATTVNCKNCNAKVNQGAAFCPGCGQDMRAPVAAKPQEDMVACAECGVAHPKTIRFCSECGNSYVPCTHCGGDVKKSTNVCSKCGKEPPKPCGKCGAALPANVRFCPECGQSTVRLCECGAALKDNARFCAECGKAAQ